VSEEPFYFLLEPFDLLLDAGSPDLIPLLVLVDSAVEHVATEAGEPRL